MSKPPESTALFACTAMARGAPLLKTGKARGRQAAWVQWALLALASAAFISSAPAHAGSDGDGSSEPQVRSNSEWREWRESLLDLRYRKAETSLQELRSRYDAARSRGDQHTQWMYLAWLASETSVKDFATSAPLLTLADQAIEAAQRTDKVAAFELVVMVEAARIRQHNEAPREASLLLAQSLSNDLDDPFRQGLVHQLRGIAATYTGQEGEALFEYRRAKDLLTGTYDQAELQYCMTLALFDDSTPSATSQSQRYLRDIEAAFPAERFPGFVDVLVRQSLLLSSLDRPDQAVTLAQRAVSVARRSGLVTPLAQAQLALGYAFLAARNPVQALSTFRSESIESLSQRGKLRTLTGQALAMALLKDAGAIAVLEQGRRLVHQQGDPNNLVAADFYEASSRVRQAVGDGDGALADLAQAGSLRSAMANTARERLLQARVAAAANEAEAAAEGARRQGLFIGVLGLSTAVAIAVALCLYQFRQRRTIGRLANDLQLANAQLESVNAARSRRLAAACHDLRQPAHVLGLLAESTSSQAPVDAIDLDQHVLAVRRCSRTLADMLDALMDTARLEQGGFEPQIEAVDLGEALAEVDLQYRKSALEKGLDWRVGTATVLVRSDRHLLRRVLFNLASNAVRYTSAGGIQIQAGVSGGRAIVEVVDTGPGIPVDRLTGHSPVDFGASATGSMGLGMGLSIVRQACGLLGHDLSVPLSSPRGSIVRVAMDVHAQSSSVQPAVDVAFARQTVAIIELDPVGRQASADALSASGLNVTAFASLEALMKASTVFEEPLPHAVVLDLHLGGRDDPTLLRHLRRSPAWRGVGILLLTGDVRPETAALAAELEIAVAYKPVSSQRLREHLARLLGDGPARHGHESESGSRVEEKLA